MIMSRSRAASDCVCESRLGEDSIGMLDADRAVSSGINRRVLSFTVD
jgi:hypothetical protein